MKIDSLFTYWDVNFTVQLLFERARRVQIKRAVHYKRATHNTYVHYISLNIL